MANIGHQFRNHRIAKNITLKKAQNDTHLREHIITAIETDDMEVFHSFAQLRGFVTIYAEYLGLDATEPLIELQTIYDAASPIKEALPPANKRNSPKTGNKPNDPPDLLEYQRVYHQIADLFKARRAELNLSLEETEWHSHIRKTTISRIENAQFEDFGSPIQAKGLLIAYAQFLEIDTELIETMFGEALLSKRVGVQKSENSKKKYRPPKRKFLFGLLTWDIIVMGSVIVTATGLLIWAITNFAAGSDTQVTARATETLSVSDVLLQQETGVPQVVDSQLSIELSATVEPIEQVEEVVIEDLPTQAEFSNVNLTIVILEKSYIRVLVDGEEKINSRGIVGNALEFHGNEEIQLITGSGRSIKAIYNGQDIGTLGNYGEPVLRIFSKNGIITPTPSITPSPTITLTPTITPRPSLTPRPSATPRP